MLAVDFDKGRADGAQHLHRHRLVVEESAGAPVGELHPAQDEFVLGRNVVGCEDRTGGMIGRHLEGGRHLALLGPLADQAGIAAPAEREGEGIEQDRFTGAGFTGQHGQARRKVDVEAVDQDDVSDRKPGQHLGVPVGRRIAAAAFLFAPVRQTFNTPYRGGGARNFGVEPVYDQRSVINQLNSLPAATIHYANRSPGWFHRQCGVLQASDSARGPRGKGY